MQHLPVNFWALMPRSASTTRKQPDNSFGQRLASIRKERGFTQVELAESLDMVQAVISDYERGKLRPYADVVARFAEVLGTTTDALIGATPVAKLVSPALNKRFARRRKAIDKLPKRDQDALIRTIDAFLGKAS